MSGPGVSKPAAALISALICLAVLSPIRQGFAARPVDDFPLSWFPMFARPRPELESPVYAVAVEPNGARHKLVQSWWTSGGFNQGATQMLRAASSGQAALDEMCGRIAKKVARKRLPEHAAVTEVHILKGSYSREAYFRDGDRAPVRERRLARCPLPVAPAPAPAEPAAPVPPEAP